VTSRPGSWSGRAPWGAGWDDWVSQGCFERGQPMLCFSELPYELRMREALFDDIAWALGELDQMVRKADVGERVCRDALKEYWRLTRLIRNNVAQLRDL